MQVSRHGQAGCSDSGSVERCVDGHYPEGHGVELCLYVDSHSDRDADVIAYPLRADRWFDRLAVELIHQRLDQVGDLVIAESPVTTERYVYLDEEHAVHSIRLEQVATILAAFRLK